MTELKAALAARLANKRKELIARPLAQIWDELAQEAMDFLHHAPAARTSPLLKREQMARALFEVGAPPHQFWADVGLDKRELYLCMADAALQHAAPSRETISIAISAIKASQAEDYYHNYEKAQQELEALL